MTLLGIGHLYTDKSRHQLTAGMDVHVLSTIYIYESNCLDKSKSFDALVYFYSYFISMLK